MADDSESILALDLQLSDHEIHLIGMIVAHWGSLEHEVFTQTLLSFEKSKSKTLDLPKAMNNLQFTQVLALWRERVVAKHSGERAIALQEVHEAIIAMKVPRDALVHGMWSWSPENPERISTVRVKKQDVITNHFDIAYLQDFAFRLARLNFKIRFPLGANDLAESRREGGFYISRKGFQLMSELAKKAESTSGT